MKLHIDLSILIKQLSIRRHFKHRWLEKWPRQAPLSPNLSTKLLKQNKCNQILHQRLLNSRKKLKPSYKSDLNEATSLRTGTRHQLTVCSITVIWKLRKRDCLSKQFPNVSEPKKCKQWGQYLKQSIYLLQIRCLELVECLLHKEINCLTNQVMQIH